MGITIRVGALRSHRGAMFLALLLGLVFTLGAAREADAAVGDLSPTDPTQQGDSGYRNRKLPRLDRITQAAEAPAWSQAAKRSKPKSRAKRQAVSSAVHNLASTQRITLGRGRIAAPNGTWKAIGVPRGDILVDLFDRRGRLRQTYGGRFERNFRSRQIETSGMRPQGMPSRQAILVGATGLAVRKVKIYIRGGGTKVVRTVRSPADWGVRNRLFAVAFNVRARYKNALIAATKVEALNARGRVMRTVRGRALNFGNY